MVGDIEVLVLPPIPFMFQEPRFPCFVQRIGDRDDAAGQKYDPVRPGLQKTRPGVTVQKFGRSVERA